MEKSGGSLDKNVDRNSDCAHEVSEGNEDFIGNWNRGHSYYIVTKHLATFYLHPEALCEAEFKTNRLRKNLVEQMSRQHSIQSFTWILVEAFIQACCENQEHKGELKDLKML